MAHDSANSTQKKQLACGHGAPAMRLEQALERVLGQLRPVAQSESLALRDGLGRVLATPVRSAIDVPAHDNSAMDGYALRGADLPATGKRTLERIGDAFAGHPFAGEVGAGQCVRIMTGGVVPAGADTVIMQERVERDGDRITFPAGLSAGQNVRRAGEDLATGSVALHAGKAIGPAELGLLASIGVAEVRVLRQLSVAFYSTGDELRGVGETLQAGEIYDSNRYTLYGMLARLGVRIIDLGVIPDQPDALSRGLEEAAAMADVVIASGGVSVGEADYVKDVLEARGRIDFWQIAMKPGRPLAFGHVDNAVFFGLPGNPVSVMATFYQIVRPALLKLSGAEPAPPLQLRARTTDRLRKSPGRREFQRGILKPDGEGGYMVSSFGHQGSGVLHSMSAGNCFIVLSEDCTTLEAGTVVNVEPFSGFM